jgi:hypothetical protein
VILIRIASIALPPAIAHLAHRCRMLAPDRARPWPSSASLVRAAAPLDRSAEPALTLRCFLSEVY